LNLQNFRGIIQTCGSGFRQLVDGCWIIGNWCCQYPVGNIFLLESWKPHPGIPRWWLVPIE